MPIECPACHSHDIEAMVLMAKTDTGIWAAHGVEGRCHCLACSHTFKAESAEVCAEINEDREHE